MATYYVRDDGDDNNDGSCNHADKAKGTIDAAKAACAASGDLVVKGDAADPRGCCPCFVKQGAGFDETIVMLRPTKKTDI